MYKPSFKTSATKVPILSKDQLDTIGENLVEDFCPDAMMHPQQIDIDRFLTNYLGADLDYKDLSHCGLYLGMTVFEDCDTVPVFNFDKWQAEYISVKAGTVLIDNCLLEEKQEHRYRFTAAHEGGHKILHHEFFTELARIAQAKENYVPMIQCRVDSTRISRHSGYNRNDREWMEWQANRLASAILMPKRMVIKTVRRAERRSCSVNAGLEAVAATFNVSNDAAWYRISELGLKN